MTHGCGAPRGTWPAEPACPRTASGGKGDGGGGGGSYAVTSARSATERFANGRSWNTSVKSGAPGGIPLIGKASEDVTVDVDL
ncbi:hypothetical protein ACWERV_27895 [Streptomyces sp. NPDC004031]